MHIRNDPSFFLNKQDKLPKAAIDIGARAIVSSKMSLSSALIATVALLIIVIVVAVVICKLASTVSGQMANPLAVIAPSVGLACVLPLILLVLIVLGKDSIMTFFSLLPDDQRRQMGPFSSIAQL
ncbi:hypothetical protein Tco_0213178 [Tanacetum coccineum]